MIASAKPLPKLKKRALSSTQRSQPNQLLGVDGELRAKNFLIRLQYRILDSNLFCREGEIDLVAFDPQTQELVFVEVKTRSSDYFGDPSAALSRKKLNALRRVAVRYCIEHHIDHDFRFDAICVLPNSIAHYQNLTWR